MMHLTDIIPLNKNYKSYFQGRIHYNKIDPQSQNIPSQKLLLILILTYEKHLAADSFCA